MTKLSLDCTSSNRTLRIRRGEEQTLILQDTITESRSIVLAITLEERAFLSVVGRFRVRGDATLALEISVLHEGDMSVSRIDVRAVAYDTARVVSIGRVVIPLTSGVDAAQYARILLVGDRASGRAEPIIEVEAQDVVCKHGSAVAPIPPEEIIFLRSRGISQVRARELFIDAFLVQ